MALQMTSGSTLPADVTAAPPCTLVIFGASGDLTKHLLIPALYNLAHEHVLDPHFAIVGVDLVQRNDNWRWSGVPFYIRTGKALAVRRTDIAIQFKRAPGVLFRDAPAGQLNPNLMVLRIQPNEGVSLRFATKVPGRTVRLSDVNMDFR
jgi:glucose-6-phosphate 1-dehydrogenase